MSFIVSLMTVLILNFTPITVGDATPSSKVCAPEIIPDPEHSDCIDPFGP
ncbi:hypothetical protein [Pseudoalteromonas tunicata]|jgi:hypothetical protein|uniref:Uncharacterized protein n=1 Tax=Pseudoalteromonas tunicata D2 TaxID=87626 RepID=A4CA45_9GAMM|nr:hypothetical protein [Pseudoalteromonas tunicata]ATC94802.1 hypothetical protein PTUN_a2300 [Pseudoalteromonas tunicata]EAR28253.1 hypothetical protein PTD2_20597 [Pseudoalteromonas tunicata D2]MDP5213460.1 hypothetical protein [Pseudoalteromonas tunicata]